MSQSNTQRTDATERTSHAARTERSDQRMLDAAVQLIVEHGPENTTLKEVGERAGYSRGLAGYRFGSKRGLFEFVIRSVGDQWLQQLTKSTKNKSGFDAIQSAVTAHYQACADDEAAFRAFYMLWFSSVENESDARNIVLSIDQRRRRDVAKWIEQSQPKSNEISASPSSPLNTSAIAAHFSATITGIAYHWLAHPDDLHGTKALHDQLIHVMSLSLQQGI